jgi:hypothetical protein
MRRTIKVSTNTKGAFMKNALLILLAMGSTIATAKTVVNPEVGTGLIQVKCYEKQANGDDVQSDYNADELQYNSKTGALMITLLGPNRGDETHLELGGYCILSKPRGE